jgi:F0F1-type ATP synthase epsilon subunit
MNVVTPLSAGDLSYIPSKAPTSALDEFADHTERIQIPGGLAMIENDMVTVIVE